MRWAAGLMVADGIGGFLPRNANPARVVNISFGGSTDCGPAYQGAIDELAANGVVVVAAAGNEHGSVTRPASCAGVVGVAALNRDGFKATYSNFGPQVAVSTVGGDWQGDGNWGSLLGDDGVLTLDNSGLQGPANPIYSRLFGTSFASPIAAGTIGLMLSVNPNLTVAQIINGLKLSARPHVTSPKIGACSANNPGRCICSIQTCGAGILDTEQALLYAQNPSGYVAPVRQPAVIDNAEVTAAVALGNDLPPNGGSTPPSSGGGGGGALGLAWLMALALAVAALAALRRRS
jgi:serine protease